MIEAIFSQPNYLAAKKSLDAIELREQAINGNLANLETPGYRRRDLAPSFQVELAHATASGNPGEIAALQPTLAPDSTAVAQSQDGNSVNLESELMQLNQNFLAHSLETQLVSGTFAKLRLAITGKS